MEYTTIIKPKNKLFDIDFKELWQYRDLFSMFVKRDIITQYKQTILGPAWFFIQPAHIREERERNEKHTNPK